VYLTDCSPAEFAPGDLIKARLIDARDYDWIAAPLGG
jgi:hypothetical protein